MTEAHPRQAVLDRFISDYDPEELDKQIDVRAHRFIAVEAVRSRRTSDHYVTGHETLRAACEFLGEFGHEPYAPEFVLDLDTGERHDLDVITKVVPTSVKALVIVLPGSEARELLHWAERGLALDTVPGAQRAIKRVRQSLDKEVSR